MEKNANLQEVLKTCREKGITLEDLLGGLSEETDSKTKVDDEKTIEQRVTDILKELGIPAHIKGYAYVRCAIIYALKDSKKIRGVTKVLYPAVAKKFGTTGSRVERAIRHAIEVACDRGGVENFTRIFGYTINPERGKPTNSEFIATVVDYININ